MAKPLGTENFAVQLFIFFPELFVMVSSAVPHFFPPSSHVFPTFHEKPMPPVGTEDAGFDMLPEFDGLDALFVLDVLEELFELDEPELPFVPDVPEEPPVLDELDGISKSSPPTLPTSVISGSL